MHRLSAVPHKSSTSLCTASRQAVLLPRRQAAADQPADACGDTASGPGRDSGPGADEIVQNPAADARRRVGLGVGGFVAYCLRSRRDRVGASPVLPAVTRVIAAGIPAVAGVPVLEEDVPAGQNCARPPMYEMGGLAQPRRARSGQLPSWRRAPPAGARHPCEGPVSRLLPRSRVAPRWSPFPTVKAFLLPPRTPRKSLKSIISVFSAIHTVSTERTQLSAPNGGYPPDNSHAVHKSPYVTPETPSPAVAVCNRPILSLRLSE